VRAPEPVSAFVREALARGLSRDAIARSLTAAGWSQPEVRAGLDAWAEVPGAPPVPRPRVTASPRAALLYLVLFAALGTVAVNLGAVLFALIDRLLPDPGALDLGGQASGVRWAIAGLLVAWPLWAWLTLAIVRAEAADPGRRRSPLGRWLTAAALFVAAVTVLGDLVAVVAWFQNGELTARFLSKAAVVALIAGAVFVIYTGTLSEEDRP
jgi:hypothetical protein